MQPPSRVKTIQAPLGGISRRVGFQNQPPFTCIDANNFWPINYKTGRSVMATRPPRRVLESPAGGGALTVNMAERINGVATGRPEQGVVVAENGQLYWWNGVDWTAATGAQAGSVATTGSVAAQTFLSRMLIQSSGKPIVFNYLDGTAVTMVETAGTVPDGLEMFAVWQGAVWAAGATDSPNVLYASRIGNALDWDFSVGINDTGGAFFTAGENEGLIRGDITAIIPHSTDTLLVGTTEGIIAIYGHPRKGGIIEDFSSRRVAGSRAWCKGPDDTTYIFTDEGIVAVPAQGGGGVIPVSSKAVPGALSFSATDLITTISPSTTMAYDRAFNGIHIYTPSFGWWFDLNTNGFWRMSYPDVLGMLEEPPVTLDIPGTVMAYGSGGMQVFDDTLDATESYSASAFLGPVQISSSVLDQAMVTQARAVVDVGQGSGTLAFATGTNGQDSFTRAAAGNAQYTRTVDPATNAETVFYPRIRGQALCIEVTATGGRTPFVVEEVAIGIGSRGVNRGNANPPPLGL